MRDKMLRGQAIAKDRQWPLHDRYDMQAVGYCWRDLSHDLHNHSLERLNVPEETS
jgi:hypothetical protein